MPARRVVSACWRRGPARALRGEPRAGRRCGSAWLPEGWGNGAAAAAPGSRCRHTPRRGRLALFHAFRQPPSGLPAAPAA